MPELIYAGGQARPSVGDMDDWLSGRGLTGDFSSFNETACNETSPELDEPQVPCYISYFAMHLASSTGFLVPSWNLARDCRPD
jgi:hypothetical protein